MAMPLSAYAQSRASSYSSVLQAGWLCPSGSGNSKCGTRSLTLFDRASSLFIYWQGTWASPLMTQVFRLASSCKTRSRVIMDTANFPWDTPTAQLQGARNVHQCSSKQSAKSTNLLGQCYISWFPRILNWIFTKWLSRHECLCDPHIWSSLGPKM